MSSPPGAAADAVFNTSELITSILEKLPTRDVARLRRLNRSTQANIDRPGPELRKVLLQDPVPRDFDRWAINMNEDGAVSRLQPTDVRNRSQVEYKPVVFNEHFVNIDPVPMVKSRSYAKRISLLRGMFWATIPVNLDSTDLRLKMLISDPPLQSIGAEVHIWEGSGIKVTVKAKDGVRLEDILWAIKTHVKRNQKGIRLAIYACTDVLPLRPDEKKVIEANMIWE